MSKVLIIPNKKEMIDELFSDYDGVILGIDGLSVNLPFSVSLEELQACQKKLEGKKLFVMLNKNMHNCDLPLLETTMKELEKYMIEGVFYYDIALVNLKEKLNLSYPLIWSQEHLTTNAGTCNFWKHYGVSGVYLSNEITLEEVKEIRKEFSGILFVNIFGYLPMFDSKRHLVNNYLDCFDLPYSTNPYYLEKEGKKYPIIDDQNGTTVYSSHILNAIPEYLDFKKIEIDYVVCNAFQIESSIFKRVLELLHCVTDKNRDSIFEEINNLCDQNIDKGFLYKETVYKIKGGE